MTDEHVPSSWALSDPPVRRGRRPEGLLSMADLASAAGLERAIELLRPDTGTTRKAAITAVHYALWTTVTLVVEPFATDKLHVVASADQLGFATDDEFDLTGFWVGHASVDPSLDAAAVGVHVGSLLRPVIDRVRQRARVGARGLELVVLDSLSSQCQQFERRERTSHQAPWAEALLMATGFRSSVPQRHLSLTVDGGPSVEFAVPRVCCVLSNTLSDHACPACPLWADDDARRKAIAASLADMDDTEFAEVVGRRRTSPLDPTAG